MNLIILDLETKKSFQETGGRKPEELEVSVVGTYFYKENLYRIFDEHQLLELEQKLSEEIQVIGFNINRFDLPALQPYFKRLNTSQLETFDLLEDLEKRLGHRISLQSLCKATLNEGKSGSGLDAIQYYRAGEMEKLKSYCLDDVRLTKDLYEFGKRCNLVSYYSKDGSQKLSVKVDWQDPAPPPNLSLF